MVHQYLRYFVSNINSLLISAPSSTRIPSSPLPSHLFCSSIYFCSYLLSPLSSTPLLYRPLSSTPLLYNTLTHHGDLRPVGVWRLENTSWGAPAKISEERLTLTANSCSARNSLQLEVRPSNII